MWQKQYQSGKGGIRGQKKNNWNKKVWIKESEVTRKIQKEIAQWKICDINNTNLGKEVLEGDSPATEWAGNMCNVLSLAAGGDWLIQYNTNTNTIQIWYKYNTI